MKNKTLSYYRIAQKLPSFAGAFLLVLSAQLAWAADPYPTAVLARNPVGYWRLDETAASPPLYQFANSGSAGSIANGYGVLDVTAGQPGIVGNCARFLNAGSSVGNCSARIDVEWSAAINPNPPFSVEFWVKPNTLGGDATGNCPLTSLNFDFNGGSSRQGWLLYMGPTGKWNLRLGNASGTYTINFTPSTGLAAVGVWEHLAFTFDGTTAVLYANGVQIGSGSGAGWLPNPRGALRLGGSKLFGNLASNPLPNVNGTAAAGNSGNRGFDGWVDEVAVYNYLLSASTIAAHHDAAATNNAGYDAQITAASPVLYLNLDEPAVTPPTSFPTVANIGTLGSPAADATVNWGALTAQPGSGFGGLGAGNKACFFDSVNGNIAVNDAAGLHFSGGVTLMAWIKPTAFDFYRGIIEHGWDGNYEETFMRISRGEGGTGAGDGTYYELGSSDDTTFYDGILYPMPPGDVGNWVFLAGTCDGSTWTLYRNGVVAGTTSATGGGALDVTNAWTIGSRALGISDATHFASQPLSFGGWIDEPAIFTNALSASDITAIYNAAQVAPQITRAVAVPGGAYKNNALSFNVWAEGSPTLGYQWTSNGVAVAVSSTTTNVTLPNLPAGTLSVQVVVTNAYGSATSSVSVVVVNSKPLITQQPVAITRYVDFPFTFSVAGVGTIPISYQWSTNGTPIPGATSSTYSGTVSAATAGTYSCLLSNEAGTSNSISVALTALAHPSGYASAIITNLVAPLAYYRLGETNGSTVAYDYVGGNNGTYNNVTLGVQGYSVIDPDTACLFGGVNDYVGNISGTSISFPGHSVFTLECWANGPEGQADESSLIAKGNGASGTTANEQFSLDVSGGNYHFFTRGGGNSIYEAFANVGPNGTWQHIVCVYDDQNSLGGGTNMYLYVNGELQGNGGPRPAGVRSSTAPVSIGAKHLGNDPAYDGYFTGTIDEVAIYPYAMSNSVVQAHYAAAYGPSLPPSIVLQPKSITNYVSLNASFLVGAGGTQPLTYQWYHGVTPLSDGPNIAGSSSEKLTVYPLTTADAGSYYVHISNVNGMSNSATVSLTVLPPPTSAPNIPGLVLHLPFDNSLADTSGRGNNAVGVHFHINHLVITSNTAAPTYVSGMLGQAMSYSTTDIDGFGTNFDNFYASLGVPNDLLFSSNVSFTVSLWIQTPANEIFGDLPYLCSGVGSTFASPGLVFAYTYGYGTSPYPGGWAYSVYDNNGVGVGGRGEIGSINDGGWHNLVHVFDRKNGATTYLDGILVPFHKQAGTSFQNAGNVDSGKYFNIGQDPTGNYVEPGSGNIDDLGVWRCAFTPLQAASIYMAGVSNSLSFAGTYTLPTLSIQTVSTNKVRLTWGPCGVLQQADSVSGPWTDVTGATSPLDVTTSLSKKFYRAKD